ncbi:MAG: glycosyltransferase family 2 protein [Cyclobacteriaceae bacterium]|nr:glycosyltransferase family 2 protein [Cyclobacteriaceae bacterium]
MRLDVKQDFEYDSRQGRELDMAWNAFQSGLILNKNYGCIEQFFEEVPIQDEYRFLKKNFHYLWSVFVLLIRILSFNDPVREVSAFRKARNVRRIVHAKTPILYPEYEVFSNEVLVQSPLVTVIIPTLNRYLWLTDVLNDLDSQSYKNFEVIVVDQSEPFQNEFYSKWNLNLRVWYQEEKALWKARNDAIRAAKGELILLYDDDSRVDSDWIFQHVKALEFFQADISSGVSISAMGDKVPSHYSYFRWSDQLDTGNVLIRRNVFEQIGLFDRQFEKQRMGDGEFGLRAYLSGFRNISNPRARRIHLKAEAGGLRQMGSWDSWRPRGWFSPRPVPSVLYLMRKYYGKTSTLRSIIVNVIPSTIPYRYKSNRLVLVIAPLFFLITSPIIIYQLSLSWNQSTKMLASGAIIEHLTKSK